MSFSQKRSDAMLKRWSDPSYVSKQREHGRKCMTALHQTPGFTGKFISKLTEFGSTTENRKLRGRRISAGWTHDSRKAAASRAVKQAHRWKKYFYRDEIMRSTWEVDFARFLDAANVRWIYEPLIELSVRSYYPDFYLPDFDLYVEIKGDHRAQELWKVREAEDLGHRFFVVMSGQIRAIRALLEIK